jgi:hypothetical protein
MDILETTPSNRSLSKDLLTVLTTATTKHSSSTHMRSTRSLLEDTVGEVDGNQLIKKGKGFEMFQLRIKTGFNRGLGTEVITHLKEYIDAVHLSLESIGAFFKRKDQLYAQICLAKGCELGPTARTAFLLDGLQRGAYQDVLKVWVNIILLGRGKLKLTSPLTDLQQAATDLLATSQFYKGNDIQAGKTHSPSARAATTSSPATTGSSSTTSHTPCDDPLIEEIVQKLRSGRGLTTAHTEHLRALYTCPHCLSNKHKYEECGALHQKYYIRPKGPHPDSTSSSTPGGK